MKNWYIVQSYSSFEKKVADTIKKIVASSNIKRVDGVLILSNSDNSDFKMDYYNNDGTWETMCANGARCAALYMYHQKIMQTYL